MSASAFAAYHRLAVAHYLKSNNLTTLGKINGNILEEITARAYEAYQAQTKTRKARGDATPEEIAVYDAYPRKVGRVDALIAIREAHSANPCIDLRVKALAFGCAVARWPQTYRYKDGRDTVPYPASWFRAGRYLDDPKEWLPAGMYQRDDDKLDNGTVGHALPLIEPSGWREAVKAHETLTIFQGRDWNTINDFYKRQIIQEAQ